MPEGVSPASMILMAVMREIFCDFLDWLVVIHDNILVLCRGYDDAYHKLVRVLDRCRERNLYLKLAKSSFGVRTVNFFGYVCSGNSYRLSEDRVQSVPAIPFPNDTKSMQRFLGAAMYFKPFIFNYSDKTGPLNDMVRQGFSWDSSTWTADYVGIFEPFKKDILNAFTLIHPDYSLDWYLYVDASDLAVGGVLVQRTPDKVQQVIAFVSQKFTAAAVLCSDTTPSVPVREWLQNGSRGSLSDSNGSRLLKAN